MIRAVTGARLIVGGLAPEDTTIRQQAVRGDMPHE